MSFYWTVATMMAVGYGDIHATSTLEMGYSILSQVAGAMVFGIIIATVNNIIVEMNPRAVIFSDRMNDLKEYMKARSLPTRLKSKIRRHYQYLWRYQSMFKEVEILCSLSRNLRHKLLMQAYGDVIQSVNILREDQEDTRFIEIVVTHARPVLGIDRRSSFRGRPSLPRCLFGSERPRNWHMQLISLYRPISMSKHGVGAIRLHQ